MNRNLSSTRSWAWIKLRLWLATRLSLSSLALPVPLKTSTLRSNLFPGSLQLLFPGLELARWYVGYEEESRLTSGALLTICCYPPSFSDYLLFILLLSLWLLHPLPATVPVIWLILLVTDSFLNHFLQWALSIRLPSCFCEAWFCAHPACLVQLPIPILLNIIVFIPCSYKSFCIFKKLFCFIMCGSVCVCGREGSN